MAMCVGIRTTTPFPPRRPWLSQDIAYSQSIEEVVNRHKKFGDEYTFWAHATSLDVITRLEPTPTDAGRFAASAFAVELEKALPTYLVNMKPQEIATVLYCFARYDRRTKLRFSQVVARNLGRKISQAREVFGQAWLRPYVDSDGWRLCYPAEIFRAMALPVPGQELASAAWVRCHTHPA